MRSGLPSNTLRTRSTARFPMSHGCPQTSWRRAAPAPWKVRRRCGARRADRSGASKGRLPASAGRGRKVFRSSARAPASSTPSSSSRATSSATMTPRTPSTAHAEERDNATLFIDELSCSLAGQTMQVEIVDDELARLYGTTHPTEKYYCRFGVNPRWRQPLHDAGLRIAGVDGPRWRRTRHAPRRPSLLRSHVVRAPDVVDGARPHPLVTAYVQRATAGRCWQRVLREEVPDRLGSVDLRRGQSEPGGAIADPGHVWPPPSMM